MHARKGHFAPGLIFRISLFFAAAFVLTATPLEAVVVRGKVTDPLGAAVPGAKASDPAQAGMLRLASSKGCKKNFEFMTKT